MPVLIRHLWQLKTVVFLHRCQWRAVLSEDIFANTKIFYGETVKFNIVNYSGPTCYACLAPARIRLQLNHARHTVPPIFDKFLVKRRIHLIWHSLIYKLSFEMRVHFRSCRRKKCLAFV